MSSIQLPERDRDGDGDEESIGKVRDPEEQDYNVRKRLQEIWTARERLHDIREELMLSKETAPDVTDRLACRVYHEELKQYLMILEPLFTDVFAEIGQEYWTEATFGTIQIEPPEEIATERQTNEYKVLDAATPKSYTFEGLETIVETSSTVSVQFDARVLTKDGEETAITREKTLVVPWDVLDGAMRASNQFVSKIGLELEPSDERGKGDAGFDYSDILENGPPEAGSGAEL